MAVNKAYTVRQALAEGLAGLRYNLAGVAGTFVVLAIVTLVMAIAATGFILAGIRAFDGQITTLSVMFIVIGVLAALVLAVLLQVFINNALALVIADGLHLRKSRIAQALGAAYASSVRVAIAQVMLLAIIVAPLVALGLVFLVLTIFGLERAGMPLLILGLIASAGWAIVMIFRYALVPLIALFEPNLRPKDTLARSYQLMKQNGSMWFLFKGLTLTLLLHILVVALLDQAAFQPGQGNLDIRAAMQTANPLVDLLTLLISIVTTAGFVAFYFNRANEPAVGAETSNE